MSHTPRLSPLPQGPSRRKVLWDQGRRLFLIVVASVIMAVNIRSFVDAGGLFPGGFNGLTLLIQRSAQQFCGLTLPFSLINFLLNAVPAVICFRLIGKRFTVYSCLSIVLTSVLTDLLPSMPLTNDVLLVSIFGGIVNGFAISLCLLGGATSGGTDFIAVAVSERLGVDAWNYILLGNAAMLAVAGLLFGRRCIPFCSNSLPPRSCTCSIPGTSAPPCSSSPTNRSRSMSESGNPPTTVRPCSTASGCITVSRGP